MSRATVLLYGLEGAYCSPLRRLACDAGFDAIDSSPASAGVAESLAWRAVADLDGCADYPPTSARFLRRHLGKRRLVALVRELSP